MGRNKIVARAVSIVLGLTLVGTVGVPGIAGATGAPLFPQCPAAGPDTGCGALITVNPNGTATVAVDPSQPALDGGSGLLVGVTDNSSVTATSVALSGPNAFALNGKGVCTVHPSPCFSAHEYGPTGYEGPGTSLVPTNSSNGTVNFSGGITPGNSTYFSLSGSPVSVTSVALEPGTDITATQIAPHALVPFSGEVATFYVGTSVTPVAAFASTVDWGDGTTTAGTVSQPGGPGTAYVVSGGHTYGSGGQVTDTVSVTDTTAPPGVGSASASATFTVVDQSVTITPAAIPAQVAGTAFSGDVATFTASNPSAAPGDFSVSLAWGDGVTSAGTVPQPGGTGTPFHVSGTHTYSTSAEFSITVAVTYGTVTTDASVPVEVDAAQTTVPCTGSCTGTVTTPLQTVSGSTSNSGGSLFVALSDGPLNCTSSTPYDYAPQITTVTTTGIPSSATVSVRVTFARQNLQGPAGAKIRVCFAWSHSFTTLDGGTATPQVVNGQTYYVGLLAACRLVPKSPGAGKGPCLASAPVPGFHNIVERIKFPAGDPRFH